MRKGQANATKYEAKLRQQGIANPEYTAYIKGIHKARESMDGFAIRNPTAQHKITEMEIVRDNAIYDQLWDHAESTVPSNTPVVRPTGKTVVPVEVVEYASPTQQDFAFLYLHGGAYTLGSPKSHRWATLGLAKRLPGVKVYAPHYALAPENRYPAGLADCISVYMELLSTHKNIVVGGDSAGGGMAVALASWLRDNGKTMPKALCLLSPWVDMTFSDPSMQLHLYDYLPDARRLKVTQPNGEPQHLEYCRDEQAMDPYVSPLITGSLKGFCPMLVQVGSVERLTSEDVAFAIKAEREGVIVKLEVYNGGPHVFQAGQSKLASLGMDQIAMFARNPAAIGSVWIKKAPNKTFTMLPFDAKQYIRGQVARLEELARTGGTLGTETRQGQAPIVTSFSPPWNESVTRPIFLGSALDVYKDLSA